jgi:hypothetical protein
MTAPERPLAPPGTAPAWYVGLDRIAARCGCSKNTLRARFDRGEFLMFKQRTGVRWSWVSNEALIVASEMARCRRDWQAQQARRQARGNGSGASSTGGVGAR